MHRPLKNHENVARSAPFACDFCSGRVIAAAVAASQASRLFSLRSQRKPGQTDRVVVRLEVGGETKYTDEGKPQREKMSVRVQPRLFRKDAGSPRRRRALRRSVRDYQKVEAVVKVGDGRFKPALRARTSPDRRRSRQADGLALLAQRKPDPRRTGRHRHSGQQPVAGSFAAGEARGRRR